MSKKRQILSTLDGDRVTGYYASMHQIQEKLLKLAENRNLGKLTYREIGRLIDESHPYKVQYHLEQLEQQGLITSNSEGTSVRKTGRDFGMLSIPILGAADCGPETIFADESIEGYLRISPKLVSKKKGLFALRAVGNSMNKANIKGNSLEDGDYALIDSGDKDPKNNDYVVSIIDGLCNIKKFIKDTAHEQIILVSESTKDFPPIYIHPDERNYFVSGKVIQVIKKPKLL